MGLCQGVGPQWKSKIAPEAIISSVTYGWQD
jgi:hypothetical protein